MNDVIRASSTACCAKDGEHRRVIGRRAKEHRRRHSVKCQWRPLVAIKRELTVSRAWCVRRRPMVRRFTRGDGDGRA